MRPDPPLPSPLERVALAALADLIRIQSPENGRTIRAQALFAGIWKRTNTGDGLTALVEFPDDADLFFAGEEEVGDDGLFGAVEVGIEGLRTPMLFSLQLTDGWMYALHGEAMGESTADIDFDAAAPGRVRLLFGDGRSAAWPLPAHIDDHCLRQLRDRRPPRPWWPDGWKDGVEPASR